MDGVYLGNWLMLLHGKLAQDLDQLGMDLKLYLPLDNLLLGHKLAL